MKTNVLITYINKIKCLNNNPYKYKVPPGPSNIPEVPYLRYPFWILNLCATALKSTGGLTSQIPKTYKEEKLSLQELNE